MQSPAVWGSTGVPDALGATAQKPLSHTGSVQTVVVVTQSLTSSQGCAPPAPPPPPPPGPVVAVEEAAATTGSSPAQPTTGDDAISKTAPAEIETDKRCFTGPS
jgi:hypothetical protein